MIWGWIQMLSGVLNTDLMLLPLLSPWQEAHWPVQQIRLDILPWLLVLYYFKGKYRLMWAVKINVLLSKTITKNYTWKSYTEMHSLPMIPGHYKPNCRLVVYYFAILLLFLLYIYPTIQIEWQFHSQFPTFTRHLEIKHLRWCLTIINI